MPIDETRRFIPINIAVLTVSDTRTAVDDTSGDTLAGRIEAAGHRVGAAPASPAGTSRPRRSTG